MRKGNEREKGEKEEEEDGEVKKKTEGTMPVIIFC